MNSHRSHCHESYSRVYVDNARGNLQDRSAAASRELAIAAAAAAVGASDIS